MDPAGPLLDSLVPLSPEESSLLVLQWAYHQQQQQEQQDRLGDDATTTRSSLPSEENPMDTAVSKKSTRSRQRLGGRLASTPPRSVGEVAARLRHLVDMLAARERLAASLGRMVAAERTAASTKAPLRPEALEQL